jgi:hypothetical protein
MPVRHAQRPWSRVRMSDRPRPVTVAVRARQPQRAAS